MNTQTEFPRLCFHLYNICMSRHGVEVEFVYRTVDMFFFFFFVRVCTFSTGQAPWKQQQRSSAFKWIKSPAQSPGPAGIGQTGCSLDEDLRLIISHVAFVFAALLLQIWVILYHNQRSSVLYLPEVKGIEVFGGICIPAPLRLFPTLQSAAAVERSLSAECIPAACLCLVCLHVARLICVTIFKLLLPFPLDPVRHSHTFCSMSAPINSINMYVLQLLGVILTLMPVQTE